MFLLLLWLMNLENISDTCEPSLGQEDNFVILENAEETNDKEDEK